MKMQTETPAGTGPVERMVRPGAEAAPLVERLRARLAGSICNPDGTYTVGNCPPDALSQEAADEIERLTELADSEGTRAVQYLRRARKAEADVALLRAALNGGNVIERLQFALQRLADAAGALGVNHFGNDWLSDEVQELQAAVDAVGSQLERRVRPVGDGA